MQLVRQLYEAGYSAEQILNLFNFLDWILALPKRLDTEFWTELKAYEQERQMPYITSVERIGFERGVKEEAQRSLERERAFILRLLNRKLGSIPDATITQINALSIEHLEALGEVLLDFESIKDLIAWLEN
ncbi:DUF4351 domain-containing protein [Cyanobacteria bacterium FACHB-63]|nr:DUF4351 domain-containing protein [Cyanobacteria bacterium FACHB-63]